MSAYRTLSSTHSLVRPLLAAAACALTLTLAAAPARADDYDATIKDIQSTMACIDVRRVSGVVSMCVE